MDEQMEKDVAAARELTEAASRMEASASARGYACPVRRMLR